MNKELLDLTGSEVAGFIADMLPEMSRLARDRNLDNLAQLLDLTHHEAERCRFEAGDAHHKKRRALMC